MKVGQVGLIGILVYSPSVGANYKIWAYQSGNSTLSQSSIIHTSSLVKAFNILILNDSHDLNFHLPRLLSEAHEKVKNEENAPLPLSAILKTEENVGSDYNRRPTVGGIGTKKMHGTDHFHDPIDIEIVENLIFKKGKTILKDIILRNEPIVCVDGESEYDPDDPFFFNHPGGQDDPNVDADLLLPWKKSVEAGLLSEYQHQNNEINGVDGDNFGNVNNNNIISNRNINDNNFINKNNIENFTRNNFHDNDNTPTNKSPTPVYFPPIDEHNKNIKQKNKKFQEKSGQKNSPQRKIILATRKPQMLPYTLSKYD